MRSDTAFYVVSVTFPLLESWKMVIAGTLKRHVPPSIPRYAQSLRNSTHPCETFVCRKLPSVFAFILIGRCGALTPFVPVALFVATLSIDK